MTPKHATLVSALFLCACSGAVDEDFTGEAQDAIRRGYNPVQGRALYGGQEKAYAFALGAAPRGSRTPRPGAPAEPLKGLRLERASLVATTASGVYPGTLFGAVSLDASDARGSEAVRLHVRESRALRAGVVEYRVDVESSAGVRPLCPSADEPAGGFATVVEGYWRRDGAPERDPAVATFACASGAIAKCIAWGYAPFLEESDRVTLLQKRTQHQTCTRMARADYCGDGQSWTLDGTPISIALPSAAGARLDPAPEGMLWEAAWTEGGAVCLGRKRWDSLAAGDLCGGRLRDPRIREERDVFSCEMRTITAPVGWVVDPRQPGGGASTGGVVNPVPLRTLSGSSGALSYPIIAVMSNQSHELDAALRTWRNGDRFVTTSEWRIGVRAGEAGAPEAGFAPFRDEGTVYHPTSRVEVRPAGLVALYRVTPFGGTESYATTAPPRGTPIRPGGPPVSLHRQTLLGWVFPPEATGLPSGARPIVRFRNTATGARVTTTQGSPGSGWEQERVEGHLPRAPMVLPRLPPGVIDPPRLPGSPTLPSLGGLRLE